MVCFVLILKDLLELCGTQIKNTNSNKTMKKKKKHKKSTAPPLGGKARVLTTVLVAVDVRNDQLQLS